MNRHLLLGLIIIVLFVTAGCPPRQPPHTPQPYSMKATQSSVFSTCIEISGQHFNPSLIGIRDM